MVVVGASAAGVGAAACGGGGLTAATGSAAWRPPNHMPNSPAAPKTATTTIPMTSHFIPDRGAGDASCSELIWRLLPFNRARWLRRDVQGQAAHTRQRQNALAQFGHERRRQQRRRGRHRPLRVDRPDDDEFAPGAVQL